MRSKLQQYYSSPGANDPLIIQIPKGHYVPMFSMGPLVCAETSELEAEDSALSSAKPDHPKHHWQLAVALVGVAGLCALAWMGGARSARSPLAPAVEGFWRSFLGNDRQPVVGYSNAQFIGTERGALLQFDAGPVGERGMIIPKPSTNSNIPALQDLRPDIGYLTYQDDYTGVGEVLGAISLCGVLDRITDQAQIKRRRLVSTFDLRSHNAVFLGSSNSGNDLILQEVLAPQKYGRRSINPPNASGRWRAEIVNLSPQPGEAVSYPTERNPKTGVLTVDYAMVHLLSGVARGRRILLLGGLTTAGTAAAAFSITDAESLTQLAHKLGVKDPDKPSQWPTYFESIWRVDLSRGLDVARCRLVAATLTRTH